MRTNAESITDVCFLNEVARWKAGVRTAHAVSGRLTIWGAVPQSFGRRRFRIKGFGRNFMAQLSAAVTAGKDQHF